MRFRKVAGIGAAASVAACALSVVGGAAFAGKPQPAPMTNPALVYKSDYGLFVAQADWSPRVQITQASGKIADMRPAWSPDGRRIAFLRAPDFTLIFSDLCVVNADGTGLRVLRSFQTLEAPNFGDTLCWSPDGRFLLYNMGGNSGRPEVVGVDSGTWATISDPLPYGGGSSWRFGRDEDASTPGYQGLLAFRCGINGWNDIAVVRAEVTEVDGAMQFALGAGMARLPMANIQNYPAWSPDGGALAFVDSGQMLKSVTVSSAGTPAFGVPTLVYDWRNQFSIQGFSGAPTWSPDGRWIAFCAYSGPLKGSTGWDLFRVRPDGTGLVAITSVTDSLRAYEPDWNPAWVNDIGQ